MSAFLPANPDARQRLLVDQIKDGALSRMVLMGIEGGSSEARAQASRALADSLRRDDTIASVINGDAAQSGEDHALLLRYRYALSPHVTPDRFSVQGLRQAIQDSIDNLGGSAGLLLKAIFPRDPTGELPALIERMAGGHVPGSQDGVWTSPDGQTALLIAMTRAAGADTDAQEQVLGRIRAAFGQAPGSADLRLSMSGTPVFSVEARQTIRGEIERLSLYGGLSILALMALFYRSLRNVVVGLLPVASGILVAVAAVALGFDTVHAVTVGFGTTLLGETLDYSIYYLVQSGSGEQWRRDYWPTIRLGVATSVCGFAALMFSSFPGLAQLGLYSMAGLLTAATVTRFVLPALPASPAPASSIRWLGARMASVLRWAQQLRWLAVALTVLALAVVLLHRDRLWSEGLAGLNPAPMDLQKLDERLRRDAGAPDLRYMVVVSAPTADGALHAAERAESLLSPLIARGDLQRINSPAQFLPSAATQAARRAALPDEPTLRSRLREATHELPVQPQRLEPFVHDVLQAREEPPITADTLRGSSFAFAVQTLLLRRSDGWSALMPLALPESADAGRAAEIRRQVDQALAGAEGLPDAFFLDLDAQATQMFGQYLDEALVFTSAGIAGVVLLLALALRDPRRVLHVLLPLAAAVVLVMAGHVLSGTRLTLLHLVGLLLTVAVGSNYALFFDRGFSATQAAARSTGAEARATALSSLALANVSTMIGFGILAWSQVPVLHAIGATVGPGALLALLLAMAWSTREGKPA
ncbi:MMPL family transporter [Ottowia sp.]|uniref:MMPL family transporter n=1 Tax=Ottowia sp. TaxID=1898956 RepID=UPI0039E548EF